MPPILHVPGSMTSRTLANSLQELSNQPYSYECFRRIYLWKHYLYAALGQRYVEAINKMLNEELMPMSYRYEVPTAIEMIIDPRYSNWVILHDYPEVAKRSVEFILHGLGEEIIDPQDLRAGETAALEFLRIELNNTYMKTMPPIA